MSTNDLSPRAPRWRRRSAPVLAAGVAATLALGASAVVRADAQTDSNTPSDPLVFVSLAPDRILDTRTGDGDNRPGGAQKLGANEQLSFDVAGTMLSYGALIPEEAEAVMVNATITEATDPTYVTLFPTGTNLPDASTLNAVFGADSSGLGSENVPNMVTVRLGDDGSVSAFNLSGDTHLIADIAGYYIPASVVGGSGGGTSLAEPTVTVPGGPSVSLLTTATAEAARFTAPFAGDYLLSAVVDAELQGASGAILAAGALAEVECAWSVPGAAAFGEALTADVAIGVAPAPVVTVPGLSRGAFDAQAVAVGLDAGEEVALNCTAVEIVGLNSEVTLDVVASGVLIATA